MAQETSAIVEGVPEEPDAASTPEETGPAPLSPGTRIAGYEVGRRLGVGSMGAVYEGVRVDDGKPVAIKLLGADLADKPTARTRFLNEATLTARVPHPHVVAVIDSGEEGERVYLVMDLLAGEDLARRLRRAGPLTVGEAIEVIGPVCDALAAAHRAGVTHRDLKPSNIFLAVRDGRLTPMLLDFGVATDEDATGAGEAPGAPSWNGLGTPMYLAPELVADHRAAGPASDQYALGAVVYEMLTGEPPYAAENLPQLLRTIAAGEPPSARARRPELPPKLDALVLRAMSADPHARFPSVEELGRALQAFAVAPDAREPQGRRRPPPSPAIAVEAETPSPFVRTLVPEHEAKSGPWFVAPDADEIPEEERALFATEGLGDDLGDDLGDAEWESRALPDEALSVEAAGAPVEGDRPAAEARDEDLPAAPSRSSPALDWRALSRFAGKHRQLVVASGIAVLGIAVLFAIRGGRTVSGPVSIPTAAAPVTVEQPAPAAPVAPPAAQKTEPTPAPPAAPAALEKTEPTPAPSATPAAALEKVEPTPAPPAAVDKTTVERASTSAAAEAREVAPPSPPAAPAHAEKGEVAPTRPEPAAATSTRPDTSPERPKAAARRERPAPARPEPPPAKVAAPAPKPRAPENTPVRLHNGVPLLD